ncbi:hypothetical protein [Streptomyces mirabilis]|uniref:hypothetical protein n=1 Tax=Streptomyces mirabilis TaxID=68239 RepID=UPI0036B650DF
MTRAALTELLVQLRRAAVGGLVPEDVFAAQVRKLGLGDSERERLRKELARLHVPVQKSVVHANIDTPDVEKVASNRVGNVFPQLDRVLILLGRYADTDGYVTSRALEGVIRLAGLDAREEAALRAAATVRTKEAAETTGEGAVAAEDDDQVTDEGAVPAGEHVEEAWPDGPEGKPLSGQTLLECGTDAGRGRALRVTGLYGRRPPTAPGVLPVRRIGSFGPYCHRRPPRTAQCLRACGQGWCPAQRCCGHRRLQIRPESRN